MAEHDDWFNLVLNNRIMLEIIMSQLDGVDLLSLLRSSKKLARTVVDNLTLGKFGYQASLFAFFEPGNGTPEDLGQLFRPHKVYKYAHLESLLASLTDDETSNVSQHAAFHCRAEQFGYDCIDWSFTTCQSVFGIEGDGVSVGSELVLVYPTVDLVEPPVKFSLFQLRPEGLDPRLVAQWTVSDDLPDDALIMAAAPVHCVRRGDRLFCVGTFFLRPEATNTWSSEVTCVGSVVDLARETVEWTKVLGLCSVGHVKPFLTGDESCGTVSLKWAGAKPLVRFFNTVTGGDIASTLVESIPAFVYGTSLDVATGCADRLAVLPATTQDFEVIPCYLFDARSGALSRTRRFRLDSGCKNPRPRELKWALHADRYLVTCLDLVGTCQQDCQHQTGARFLLWDLESGESEASNAIEKPHKSIMFEGYIPVGPNMTGNVWFLMKHQDKEENSSRPRIYKVHISKPFLE